jgi:hypothetical protein
MSTTSVDLQKAAKEHLGLEGTFADERSRGTRTTGLGSTIPRCLIHVAAAEDH